MAETRRDSNGSPIGVGPGITGASGDFITSTGGNQGVGGTGHESDDDVAGARPDERQGISRQELVERGADPMDGGSHEDSSDPAEAGSHEDR